MEKLGDRSEAALSLVDHLGERLALCPASSRKEYHLAEPGGLVDHSLRVLSNALKLCKTFGWNVPKESLIVACLLHDIGKCPDNDEETPHALLGMKLCEKFGEHPEVINAVGAHHDEIEMTSLLSPVIQACDAISGSRPGARRGDDQYVERIKEMETMALSYPGVEKAYAIQAGRELRIIMAAEKSNDENADTLAFELSNRIMTEMRYPGQVKITVIREKRAVGISK